MVTMASDPHPPGELQLSEDRRWQEYLWTTQRIGWVLMAVFVLAAILGLTGSGGPLATASATTPGGTVEYPRVARWAAKEQIVFKVPASAQGSVELTLSPDFNDVFAVDAIVPRPASSAATAAGHRYAFDLEGAGAKAIVFNVTAGPPALFPRVSARFGSSSPAEMRVVVLP